ncbi:hypothetical protein J437_LFUL008472 [Ladona fulva]|uniref:Pacifastin domain-containing protein n=1 Tax=Ladona fulva TaxID=123851 RepID=A0A8K0K4L1_LADFU|nr:hypothetical protein J437_LFUL008472 [Ladona fulva]
MKTYQVAIFAFIAIFLVLSPDLADAARRCQPGERWQEDCNSCFCSDSGVAACTLKGCLGNRRPGQTLTSINQPGK